MYVPINNNNKNWKKGVFGSSQFICNVFEHVYQFEFSHNSKQFLVLLLWLFHYFQFFHSIFFSKFIHFMLAAKLYAKIIFVSLPQLLPQRERNQRLLLI